MLTGPEYVRINDAQRRIDFARVRIASWDDAAARREATSVLNVLEHFAQGQRDLFERKDDFEMAPELSEKLWNLLTAEPGDPTASSTA